MRNLKIRLTAIAVGMVLLALALGWFGPELLAEVSGQVRAEYLALAAFVFLGLYGVAFHGLLERALTPVVTLTDNFVRMRAGDLNPRLPVDGSDEMQHLSRTFNEMMEELELQIREVSEEKYAAERGRQYLQEQVEAVQRFKDLVDSAPIGIVLADADRNVIYQNATSEASFLQLSAHLPWNTEVVVGRHLSFLYPSEEEARELLSDADNLPFETSGNVGPFLVQLISGAVYSAEGDYLGPVLMWDLQPSDAGETAGTEDEAALDDLIQGFEGEAASPEDGALEETDPEQPVASGHETPPTNGSSPVASAPLRRTSALVGRSVRMIADRLTTVTSMVEALRNEEESLRQSLEEIRRRTQHAAYLTNERSETLWELVDEAKGVGERAKMSTSLVKRLRRGFADAEAIRSSVSHLADAIDLMVIQARVEVGRAGEAGAGLGVVVDEVKRVGRDAARLSKDVQGKLEKIGGDLDEALTVLAEDKVQVRATSRLARRAESALGRIEQDMGDVNERTDLVAEMAEAQSEIGVQITSQLGRLSDLIDMTARVAADQARLLDEAEQATGEREGEAASDGA